MDEDLKRIILIFSLQNAVKHHGVPKSGTVIGMVMGKYPELRTRAKEIGPLLGGVLAEVEGMSHEEREIRLQELAPDVVEEMARPRVHIKELPPLEKAESGVVMRFAPNPSGPLHLGHARAAVLNDAYVRRYGGRYVLRIEDTDPKRVDPEAYRMVQEDIGWLGLNITDIVYQSDRFDLYYKYGRELIERGGAYVCTCDNEMFRELKQAKTACPCRSAEIEDNLESWEKMLGGEFYEGSASVRVRTDLDHPDPAMRDYPAFRILNSPPHPRIEATVYPLMNFSVAVDDHLLGITHVIRGKDHIANTRRQRYIFDYFGWDVPVYRHYGRMGIEGVVLSTSQMREGIRSGVYHGWDDIRLGTLRAFARRGIKPEAVRDAVMDIGVGDTDISFSWENLYAQNKNIIDPVSNRYFFVPDPVMVHISDAPRQVAHPLLHPGQDDKGTRTLPFNESVLVPSSEIKDAGTMIRLKDLFNIMIESAGNQPQAVFTGDSLAEARASKAQIIQWLPVENAIPCRLLTQEGDLEGVCEPGVMKEEGNVVQFERVGFARIDAVKPEGIIAYFSHR